MYPTASQIARLTEEPTNLKNGYKLPAQSLVLCHTHVAGRQEENFTSADQFLPGIPNIAKNIFEFLSEQNFQFTFSLPQDTLSHSALKISQFFFQSVGYQTNAIQIGIINPRLLYHSDLAKEYVQENG